VLDSTSSSTVAAAAAKSQFCGWC